MLADKNTYLTSGIYIGMKSCTPYMKHFVYKIREDGLGMFNLKRIDERIKVAGFFLSKFKNIIVVGRKENSFQAIDAFAKAAGAKAIIGRFPPGMLTNPSFKEFCEPDVVIVADPVIDEQAVKEASAKRIPIVGICNTFNSVKYVDFVIPANNNGKKSLALIFWLLAREVLKNRDEIKEDSDFSLTLKDFGDTEPVEKKEKVQERDIGIDEETHAAQAEGKKAKKRKSADEKVKKPGKDKKKGKADKD
ncbi:MAG: 30S ribosomal protein S2 [Candidatus Aenigmarchaeota archaeon]|nr:30S ribosomal protein S2 [Candidatus Aenigmarchaeota archaeon]